MVKPVLKWAGGKRVILNKIEERLIRLSQYINLNNTTFYDVFTGAGSVTLKFCSYFKKCVINDTNKELINVYNIVRDQPQQLMVLLDEHCRNHNKEYYYKIRNKDREINYKDMSNLEKAARTIYLNKTCYNGLYRVNSKNQFNVPLGRQKKISLYDRNNIIELSKLLIDFEISNHDFTVPLKKCIPGDVVYLDPPYDKINGNSFIEYNSNRFDEFDQERLKIEIDNLTEKGVYVIASNSLTENTRKLYREYLNEESIIPVIRSIASKSNSRKPVAEILIDNFEKVNMR